MISTDRPDPKRIATHLLEVVRSGLNGCKRHGIVRPHANGAVCRRMVAVLWRQLSYAVWDPF